MEFDSSNRKFFGPRTVATLRSYNKQISPRYLMFFADLKELLVPAIHEQVFRAAKANQHGPFTVNLRVLGSDEASAKPWIVILCEPRISHKVKRFCKEDWVKSLCQPGPAWPDLDHVQILVHPTAPLLQAAHFVATVIGDPRIARAYGNNLSSRMVQIEHRKVTIGGAVTVVCDNEVHCMGMTAGHGFNGTKSLSTLDINIEGAAESLRELDEDLAASDDLAVDEAEVFELDLENTTHSILGTSETFDSAKSSQGALGHRGAEEEIGDLVEFSNNDSNISSRRRLDWALIRTKIPHSKPNYVYVRDRPHAYRRWIQLSLSEYPLSESNLADKTACLVSGLRGQLFGTLSFGVSVFSPGAGYDPASVHLLRLTPFANSSKLPGAQSSNAPVKLGLIPGECGSWVIDASTGYVYGHAVASDLFGDIYVVPMAAILGDIKAIMGASSVSLSRLTIWDRRPRR